MKYAVVLCDGMADYPIDSLHGATPMQAAVKPTMDALARYAEVGLVKTVPDQLAPGSDVANLSVMGYDPAAYYTGRSPLEAASIGIDLADDDVTLRCNLVTLSEEAGYEEKTMVDYCADDISTAEAHELIQAVQEKLGSERFSFYPGVSYRHCLVWKHGDPRPGKLTPPHDITGRPVAGHLPEGDGAKPLLAMMKESYEILKEHPVNLARIQRGKRPANSIWLWGEGMRPRLDSFYEKFGVKGSVISAVDLIKGIGLCAKMHSCDVEGATGYIDTNFAGKTEAALRELAEGQDFVYLHLEAPDECGHRNELIKKIQSIGLIDRFVLKPLREGMAKLGDYSIMVLPDHPTPISTRTHASDPVPYLIYRSNAEQESGVLSFSEASAKTTGIYCAQGHNLMKHFLEKE